MSSRDIESSPVPVVCQGLILNDNGLDVDHLFHVVYAEALAQQIDSIKSPMTIGLFARWGSGKSFLLKHFQSLLISLQEKRNKKRKKSAFSKIIRISVALIFLTLLGLAITAFVSVTVTVYLGITLLFILFLVLVIWFSVGKSDSVNAKPRVGFFRVILYALFTQLPIRKIKFPSIPITDGKEKKFGIAPREEQDKAMKERNEKNRRFIFVNYNAWQYVGCDVLWAGIVTTLAERIEAEFGVFTTRMFRSLSIDLVEEKKSSEDNNESYPRTTYILALLGTVLVIFVSAALLIYILIIDETGDLTEGTLVDEILVFLPAGITVLFGALRSLYALFNSHKSKVTKALQGANKDFSNELGFMEKIRNEIQSIIDLVHTVELSHGIEYKVVITIDDLDRVPLSKVKSILENVNILLSDRNSPFICIIAVDLRIACDCFSADQENKDIPSSVNGHEYLKKIINLPFCIHEIDNKAKPSFIYGLTKESDLIVERQKTSKRKKKTEGESLPRPGAPPSPRPGTSYSFRQAAPQGEILRSVRKPRSAPRFRSILPKLFPLPWQRGRMTGSAAYSQTFLPLPDEQSRPDEPSRPDEASLPLPVKHSMAVFAQFSKPKPSPLKAGFDLQDFLVKCRNLMHREKKLMKFMMGNPRNLKRIFNVISMTACLIDIIQKQKNKDPENSLRNYKDNNISADELLCWVVLTEQWPFRSSYIFVVIEIASKRKRSEESKPLFKVYNNILKDEVENMHSHINLLSLDYDVRILEKFLYSCRDLLTIDTAKRLWKYTINLDSNIMKSISLERDKWIESNKKNSGGCYEQRPMEKKDPLWRPLTGTAER